MVRNPIAGLIRILKDIDKRIVNNMPSRLADHFSAARRHRFVGRENECAVLQTALRAEKWPFFILNVFGPGGVGKTTLLQEFAALSRQHNVNVIALDARNLDASPNSLMLALQLSLGLDALGLGTESSPLDFLAA